jgi:hypothetical protein
MWWIVFVVLQGVIIWSGIRREERAGLWSWSKFAFALGFAGLEVVVISAPLALMDMKSRYFWPVYGTAWVVAAGNFVWFIIVARRWKLPNGKTSLEADREQRRK